MIGLNYIVSMMARNVKSGPPATTFGERFADRVTAAVGSLKFIVWQSVAITVWVFVNLDGIVHFDPYPFILLNLALSFQAAFTAPFIMMSQNRQSAIDRMTITEDLLLDKGTASNIQRILELLSQISANTGA